MLNLSLNNQKIKISNFKICTPTPQQNPLLWEHHIYEKGSQKPTEKYKSKT